MREHADLLVRPPRAVPARTVPSSAAKGAGQALSWAARLMWWLAVGWIGLAVLVALVADVLPLRPYDVAVPELGTRTPPSWGFPELFGTDAVGRSTLSRVVYGMRQSLLVGVASVGIAMTFGLAIGLAAGYLRGRLDALVGIGLDVLLSVPPLVLLLAIAAVGRRSVATVIAGLAVVGIPTFARLARASTLVLADRDYITAATAMGAGRLRIAVRELLPQVAVTLSTYAFVFLPIVVVAEGTLSFLGLGIPPPAPSLGGMIDEGRPHLGTDPFLVAIPAGLLVLTVAAFGAVGDRLHRRLHPGAAVVT